MVNAHGTVTSTGIDNSHDVSEESVSRNLDNAPNATQVLDEWLQLEELAHCPEKVAEYDAAAPRRRAALGLGPTPRPCLFQPPRRQHRRRLWHPPGFGSRFRPRS